MWTDSTLQLKLYMRHGFVDRRVKETKLQSVEQPCNNMTDWSVAYC